MVADSVEGRSGRSLAGALNTPLAQDYSLVEELPW